MNVHLFEGQSISWEREKGSMLNALLANFNTSRSLTRQRIVAVCGQTPQVIEKGMNHVSYEGSL